MKTRRCTNAQTKIGSLHCGLMHLVVVEIFTAATAVLSNSFLTVGTNDGFNHHLLEVFVIFSSRAGTKFSDRGRCTVAGRDSFNQFSETFTEILHQRIRLSAAVKGDHSLFRNGVCCSLVSVQLRGFHRPNIGRVKPHVLRALNNGAGHIKSIDA